MITALSMAGRNISNRSSSSVMEPVAVNKGMVLPFQPLSMAFDNVNYYVDMPVVSPHLNIFSFMPCKLKHLQTINTFDKEGNNSDNLKDFELHSCI